MPPKKEQKSLPQRQKKRQNRKKTKTLAITSTGPTVSSDTLALALRKLTTLRFGVQEEDFELVESREAKKGDTKPGGTYDITRVKAPVFAKEKPLQAFLQTLSTTGLKSLGFDRWSGFLYGATNITYNSSATKYLQFFGSTTKLQCSSLANAAEFTTLDALYDETFLHAMEVTFVPRNSYNTAAYCTQAGDFKNAGTCAATIVALMHNATAYSDASNVWSSMRSQRQHAVVDLAKRWTFTWKNNERFDWGAPLGDETTALATTGWIQNSLVSTVMGGFMQIGTVLGTGASLGIPTLLEGSVPGDLTIRYHLSMRARG